LRGAAQCRARRSAAADRVEGLRAHGRSAPQGVLGRHGLDRRLRLRRGARRRSRAAPVGPRALAPRRGRRRPQLRPAPARRNGTGRQRRAAPPPLPRGARAVLRGSAGGKAMSTASASTRARVVWSAAVVVAASLPHWPLLPAWLPMTLCVAVAWRLAADRLGWRPPGRALRMLLAAAALCGVLAEFRTINGVIAGSALLVVMVA